MGYQYKKKQAQSKPLPFKKEWKEFFVDVELPSGVSGEYDGFEVKVKGEKGELTKQLKYPNVTIEFKEGKVTIGTKKLSKREKKIIFTYKAHLKNLVIGVTEGFTYELAAVYAKFPLTLEVKGQVFTLKNLLGEKVPRTLTFSEDVKVEVKGQQIIVSGIDKEKTGQVAASLEQLTKINNLDRRVVQDGIFITKKPHKEYI